MWNNIARVLDVLFFLTGVFLIWTNDDGSGEIIGWIIILFVWIEFSIERSWQFTKRDVYKHKKQDPTIIYEVDNKKYNIPFKLNTIYLTIVESKGILSLEEGWDDEGALKIKEQSWNSCIRFLLEYSIWLYENNGIVLPAPSINPGKDGSLDLSWMTETVRLLINIKNSEEEEAIALFYGDQYKDLNSIKGSIYLKDSIEEYLAVWMKKLKN